MAVYIIPISRISPEALQGVIEEFISREGTDYGEVTFSLRTDFRQVKQRLTNGSAVLVFDDETKSPNILWADDSALAKARFLANRGGP
jgi:uncharacterized protein